MAPHFIDLKLPFRGLAHAAVELARNGFSHAHSPCSSLRNHPLRGGESYESGDEIIGNHTPFDTYSAPNVADNP